MNAPLPYQYFFAFSKLVKPAEQPTFDDSGCDIRLLNEVSDE